MSNNNNSSQNLCEWYFTTKFEVPTLPQECPQRFAILTAYNPFNQLLTEAENIARNKVLLNKLQQSYTWIYEINGFDEETQHKENGFMFNEESFNKACDLGEEFSQDAIYYVIDNILFVSKCAKTKRQLVEVGCFTNRIIV
ncbi:MAG: hypothetical protein Kow0076_5100 [Francisella sp.]